MVRSDFYFTPRDVDIIYGTYNIKNVTNRYIQHYIYHFKWINNSCWFSWSLYFHKYPNTAAGSLVLYILYILVYIKFIYSLTCLQIIQHKVQIYTILMMVKKWYKIHEFVSKWFKFLTIIKFDKFNIYYKKIYNLLPNISLVIANLVLFMIFIFFSREEVKVKFSSGSLTKSAGVWWKRKMRKKRKRRERKKRKREKEELFKR